MNLTTTYLFRIAGEDPANFCHLHPSTIARIKALGIAVHIPVAIWAVTSYVAASRVFAFSDAQAIAIAGFCAVLIYLVERLIIATPKNYGMSVGRVIIGFVIAVLGACSLDLALFEPEITRQLIDKQHAQIVRDFNRRIEDQSTITSTARQDWLRSQDAANCEANGTCGSRSRNLGPIYSELAKQAQALKSEYLAELAKLTALKTAMDLAVSESTTKLLFPAGLLERIEALHNYVSTSRAAFVVWTLLFLLVFLFEMLVVISKLAFGETVDDKITAFRENLQAHKAACFFAVGTSGVARANDMLDEIYHMP